MNVNFEAIENGITMNYQIMIKDIMKENIEILSL